MPILHLTLVPNQVVAFLVWESLYLKLLPVFFSFMEDGDQRSPLLLSKPLTLFCEHFTSCEFFMGILLSSKFRKGLLCILCHCSKLNHC